MIAGMNGGKVTKNSQGNKKLQKLRCFYFLDRDFSYEWRKIIIKTDFGTWYKRRADFEARPCGTVCQ